MDIDERLAAVTMNLELLSRDREDDQRRYAADHEAQMLKFKEQGRLIQALFLLAEEQVKVAEEQAKTAEEHTKSLERDGERIQALFRMAEQDGEHIRSLAHIAEIHERRLTGLEHAP